ncbi:MAG: CBS domain-containing protein, partial [Chromatiales bacterium]|nr:CBS domain-containing protein [Chromatiales bacterium]
MDESQHVERLTRMVRARVPLDAALLLSREPAATVATVLDAVPLALARDIVEHLPPTLRPVGLSGLSTELDIPGTVADLMEAVLGVLPESATVQDAIAFLRAAGDTARQITYLYATDGDGRLSGAIVIRDLLLAQADQPLTEIMIIHPFALPIGMETGDAIKAAIHRHYPVYPVVDADGRIRGVVRGWRLFERQAIEITAQTGQMVGVDKDERVFSGFWQAFRMRHPWLQLNL